MSGPAPPSKWWYLALPLFPVLFVGLVVGGVLWVVASDLLGDGSAWYRLRGLEPPGSAESGAGSREAP